MTCISDNTFPLSASKAKISNEGALRRRTREERYTKESNVTKEWTQMQEKLLQVDRIIEKALLRKTNAGRNVNK